MFSNEKFWDNLAVESYRFILKGKPGNAQIFMKLGLAYARTGKVVKAIRAFQKSIKLDKNNAETHYHLSKIYNEIGKEDDARRSMRKYSKLIREQETNTTKKASASRSMEDMLEQLRKR